MKNKPAGIVAELAGSCLYTIIRAVVEDWSREVIGDLIGRRVKNRFILVNAYPWLTAERKPTEARPGNLAARQRVIDLAKVINPKGGLGNAIIGYFHSHIFWSAEERESYLGTEDQEFFSEDLKMVGRKEAVLIVVSVRVKDLKQEYQPRVEFLEYPKSLRVTAVLASEPGRSYDLILTAFRLRLKGQRRRVERIKIVRRQVQVREKVVL